MGFNVTTRDAIECIKNLKKIRHDGMQFDACLSKAISDLEEYEECKKKYGWIFNYSNIVAKHNWDAIERALGFKLFVWQKMWVDDLCDVYGQRRTGKTVADCLKILLAGDMSKLIDMSMPPTNAQNKMFRDTLLDIKKKLDKAGVETRPVFFSEMDKKEYYKKQKEKESILSNTLHYNIHKMTEKLIKDENELLYRCLYSYGITKENLLNNIDRIELREVTDFGINSVKRFYIDGKYAFTIKRVSTMITNKPTAGYTERSLCYKVEKIIEDLEESQRKENN